MAVNTIGSTNPSGAVSGQTVGPGANSLWLTKRTLSGVAAGAKWTALRGYLSSASGASSTKIILALYDDLSNSPNHPVAWGELTIAANTAAAEFTFTLPGTAAATNGSYWLGFWVPATNGPLPYMATSGGTMAYGTPTYTSAGPPDPYNETAVNGVDDIRIAADATDPAAVPVADFTGTPTSGSVPLSVVFTDASTNTPTSWSWDFGDGGTSTSQNPTHSYAAGGTYTVTLIATNTAGSNTKTRTAYITATEAVVYATGGGIDIW